ncbi:GntR family transcriptional regulator [Brenneria goodwinii]|uniref:Transcriptional regulator, GntR family n=2 Tax=Brenneria goodwinii TaxID=1109412 RepID=A0A0G4JX24_9GAMM|nr:GntR family transcriptional regulator [Brenneria goodwinii]MCG8156757.1 GntR family transcriptional regulator [Brenneria goodwinii]MCG8160237.1 GntR family transcriptional regulator [Brenneria goodwinii]MCG8164760.1 GntR family transcriptional regulator [Brenneria goodwinii]MCG8171590.1 GntR family transcriptional regulator [Brenneria goodwinii]MCG8174062.1 GntR family transcriptional regulator [Brenneria goodwinii]
MKKESSENRTLSDSVAEALRNRITHGELRPGQRLSEAALSESLDISRNTLREVFRILTLEGLLKHEPNRGVFVATPDMATIVDIYRVRRLVECQALARSYPMHPAVEKMRQAVEQARVCRQRRDWMGIGTANMAFHTAIVELADSQRLNTFYRHVSAELRLAFDLLDDPEHLHVPYIEMNAHILTLIESDKAAESADALASYLDQSERIILAAWSRRTA